MLLTALLLAPPLAAHPGSATGAPSAYRDYLGHRVELVVGAADATVTYVCELPERRVLEEARDTKGGGYATKLLDALAGEVKLTWNGEALPAARIDVAEPVKPGDGGFLDFAVALRAALPDGAGRIGVRNGNYPGDQGFFATAVTLDGRWMADASSLLKVKKGRLRDNWHGAWVKDETAREPWVDLRPAGLFERASAPAPLPRRMSGVEGDGLPWWAHLAGVLSLLALAWLGRLLGRRANRIHQESGR